MSCTADSRKDSHSQSRTSRGPGQNSKGKSRIWLDRRTPGKEKTDILIAMVGKTEEGDEVWMATTEELLEEDEIWINTKTSNSIEFHLLHNVKKDDFLLMEQIPEEYHKFIRVFDEKEANCFPKSRVWDHKIELKEGFQPKLFKTYNLTLKSKENWTSS